VSAIRRASLVLGLEDLTEGGKILERRAGHVESNDIAEGWVFLQNRQVGYMPSLDADLFRRLIEVLGR